MKPAGFDDTDGPLILASRYTGYRHKRGFRCGWHQVAHLSSDNPGIISLNGIVVASRPNKP